jgi:raffinose/stachyose/melibiose transport system permease protein
MNTLRDSTVVSVAVLVILSAMVAHIWQRRGGRLGSVVNILGAGRIDCAASGRSTIWVLQKVGLFKTMPGLIFVEIAYGLPFCILLFRAFMSSVPRELDEAAVVDGAGPVQIFSGDLPSAALGDHDGDHLAVGVLYKRFQNRLYFLPGTHECDRFS